MRFDPKFLDEIRARLPVSQVVGRRVALKKKGREFAGLSPFKSEKTPSFFVNDQKGFYHCFASGEHGDIFTFVMKTEGLGFAEAVERLAADAGVPLPPKDPEQAKAFEKRTPLYEVLQAASLFFQAQLASSVGQTARQYLTDRGISTKTQSEFSIGFAPEGRHALKAALIKLGFSEAQLLESGLLVQPEDGGAPYDRFRDRVMIPIHDHRGRVIAFGGRALKREVIPKYLNSPETPIFTKGANLFNFHRARQAAFDTDDVVVVEGYLDAISVYQAGVKNVVASLGTALTENQIEVLWRLASSPTICFDGDRAGRDASYRAIDRILPRLRSGKSFRFAFITTAKDPDELIRQFGVAAFEKIVGSATPLHDAIWNRAVAGADLSSPERKAAFEQTVLRQLEVIADPNLKRHYLSTFRVRLSKFFWDSDQGKQSSRPKPRTPLTPPDGQARELILIGISVENPALVEMNEDQLLCLELAPDNEGCIRALHTLITLDGLLPVAAIYSSIDPAFYHVLDRAHGASNTDKGLLSGHQLRARCPVLKLDPSADFVERLYKLTILQLQLRSAEREYFRALDEIPADAGDTYDELLRQMKLSLDAQHAEIHRSEFALLEEADAMYSGDYHKSRKAA